MKDLFRVVFDQLSQFDFATYEAEFLQRAPFRILDTAASEHPALREVDGFRGLYANLDATSAQQWSNPELYPHLFRLLSAGDGAKAPAAVRALRAHLELDPISAELFEEHRYVRCRATRPRTFERTASEIVEVPATLEIDEFGAHFPVVYLPFPNLFDDIVGPNVYFGGDRPATEPEIRRHVVDACLAMRGYDADLFAGFCDAIGTIGITGERGMNVRRSYSAETFFAGGIFAALLENNVPSLVESFMHEYYHQRLFLWWLIEAPADLPPESLTIVSPVTNTERSAFVMLHALLIYVGACDFYRHCIARGCEPAAWCARRLEHLERGTKQLAVELERVLAGRPECVRFLRLVIEQAPWEPPLTASH